jgi:hypothetical protein
MTTVTVCGSPASDHTELVGIICNEDHQTFGPVADQLRSRGYDVEFFQPGVELYPTDLDRLALLVNKKTEPASYRALQYAETHGIPTWNGTTAFLLNARLVAKKALEVAGFRVPPVSFEPPDGPYVAKEVFDWHTQAVPTVGGEGDFYEPLLDAEPFDFKYYIVDDGLTRHVRCVLARSKLYGEKECLGLVDPDPDVVPKLEHLLALTGARALGVDVVVAEGTNYAVDVNPTMSFRDADLVDAVTDSIVDCLRTAPPRLRVER